MSNFPAGLSTMAARTMSQLPEKDPERPIRVLIVDDHLMVIDGLKAILGQEPNIIIVGDASNGMEAVERSRALRPDVVIMDISMPEMDGIEATRLIRDRKVKDPPAVLALSMYGNMEMVEEMMAAGASGYVLKNTGRAELQEALRTVMRGERFRSTGLMDQSNTSDGGTLGRKVTVLSKREREVVKLLVADKTIAEVADLLFLSPGTVESHKKNIYHKLGIHSATALVKYAMERGWGGDAIDM
jgi:two-component system, NarL family, nitrate/nitrite response regulator NarL